MRPAQILNIALVRPSFRHGSFEFAFRSLDNRTALIRGEPIGLALAGGGAKGAYQVGVLKALNELSLHPDVVAGTSIGALNGAFFCRGDTPMLERLWRGINPEETVRWTWIDQVGLYIRALGSFGDWLAVSQTRLRGLILSAGIAAALLLCVSVGLVAGGAGLIALTLLLVVIVVSTGVLVLIGLGPVFNWVGSSLLRHKNPFKLLVERYIHEAVWKEPWRPLIVTLAREERIFDPDRPSWRWSGLTARAGARKAWVPKYVNLTQRSPGQAQSSILRSSAMPFVIEDTSPRWGSRQVDAGVVDNVPIKPLMDQGCVLIIAVHLNRNGKDGRWKLVDELQLRDRMEEIHRLQTLADLGPEQTLDRFGAHVDDPTIYRYYLTRIMRRIFREERHPAPILETQYGWVPSKVVHIVPSTSLGNFFTGTLNFSREKANRLIDLGYEDTKAILSLELTEDSLGWSASQP